MKREYFGMLYLLAFVPVILIAGFFFGEEVVEDHLKRYVVILVLLSYYIGQYSMRFPKRF